MELKANQYTEYKDGIFLTKEGWHVVETNISRMQEECDKWRNEAERVNKLLGAE